MRVTEFLERLSEAVELPKLRKPWNVSFEQLGPQLRRIDGLDFFHSRDLHVRRRKDTFRDVPDFIQCHSRNVGREAETRFVVFDTAPFVFSAAAAPAGLVTA